MMHVQHDPLVRVWEVIKFAPDGWSEILGRYPSARQAEGKAAKVHLRRGCRCFVRYTDIRSSELTDFLGGWLPPRVRASAPRGSRRRPRSLEREGNGS